MKYKIKKGTLLILYNKQKPKIQGICIAAYKDYCILKSLQSGYEYRVFYSNPCLKVTKEIDFRLLVLLDIGLSLKRINFRVLQNISKSF